MADRPRAADDAEVIFTRITELRREREQRLANEGAPQPQPGAPQPGPDMTGGGAYC